MAIRYLLLAVLTALCGCSRTNDCGAETEEFSMREPLTEDEWAQVQDAWGDPETEEAACNWACASAYERLMGWELQEIERCLLDVESSGDTADPVYSPSVVCSATGAEFLCD
jgi:hypothetical protein